MEESLRGYVGSPLADSSAPCVTPVPQAALDAVDYYRKSRSEMLALLPPEPKRLIDIGCGEGFFGEAVKARFPGCETWGVEPVVAAAKMAATRNDRILNAPLDGVSELPDGYFDVVTMNDVLEHIAWPEPALAAAKRVLKPDGRLVISLPNVQYLPNVLDLVQHNDWEYQDYGVLDRTHFRFYTSKSATRMLERNGFKVEQVTGLNPMRPKWYFRVVFAMAPKYFYWMPFLQFAVVAKPLK